MRFCNFTIGTSCNRNYLSIVGTFFVKVSDGGSPHKALNLGEFLSALLMLIASYFIITNLLPSNWSINGKRIFLLEPFGQPLQV